MTEISVKGLVFELVTCQAGKFVMGSSNELFGEAPPHCVVHAGSFCLGKYPVTQAQWQAVMGNNPSAFAGADDHPVESVSWEDATRFCQVVSDHCGRQVSLPSEAQWEYACRAGTTGEFFFSLEGPWNDESEIPRPIRQVLAEYAWFDLNSGDRTHPVGQKRPNPWGFHDILGNVWEWCADTWHASYVGAPSDGVPWLDNETLQPRPCLRGGAWDMNSFRCRSTYRSFDWKELATNRFGLRIAVLS
jgi:formylglycine-generating enzyme required for sulfatase activity